MTSDPRVRLTHQKPFKAVKTDDGFMLPIDAIYITSIVDGERLYTAFDGNQIAAVPEHDIATGTVTVTFLNVEEVKVQYKHNREDHA